MRPASTPSSRRGKFSVVSFQLPVNEAVAGFCRGRLLRWVFCVLSVAGTLAATQAIPQQATKKVATHRANELTLAGLRPGRDTLARALQVNSQFKRKANPQDFQTEWFDVCRDASLTVDTDGERGIRVMRTGLWGGSTADCSRMPPGPWKTGRGLRVGDLTSKATQLYGEPDSKSPSTRDGQPLELWYYAFDWAGPDVPQVMEILCTREKEGQPGRVIEITLAAPSL